MALGMAYAKALRQERTCAVPATESRPAELSRGRELYLAIFRAVKQSHFIAGSVSTSWNPSENTVLVPFFSGGVLK